MPEIVLRESVTTPGDILLTPLPPHDAALRLGRFLAASGLDSGDVLTSPTCCTPVPRYPAEWPAGRRRWTGVRPEAMWHPLLWLPTRLAQRVPLDIGGVHRFENDEEWIARVAVELAAAGFYHEETGCWADVLALSGLDVTNTPHLDRIGLWLAGGIDDDLDQIDLSGYLDPADPDTDPQWAVHEVHDALDLLHPVGWVVTSHTLLRDVDDMLDAADQMTDEQLLDGYRTVGLMAADSLRYLDGESAWWFSQLDAIEPESLRAFGLPAARDRLAAVIDEHTADMAEALAYAEQVDPEPQRLEPSTVDW